MKTIMKWELVDFVTEDNIKLQGILYLPPRVEGVVIIVHGFTGNFTSRYAFHNLLAAKLSQHKWGVLAFNNRGFGVINSFHKVDPTRPKGYTSVTIGGVYEKFEDCVLDIRGAIDHLHSRGVREIILVGSSTGANKVAYFAGNTEVRNLKGLVLMGAVSDIEAFRNDLLERYDEIVGEARKLVKKGKGREIIELGGGNSISAERLVSMTTAGGREEVFPYTDPRAKFTTLSKIKVPILALFGENDEYMKADKEKVLNLYRKHAGTTNFKGTIIGGAYHSFGGYEEEVTKLIKDWIISLKI